MAERMTNDQIDKIVEIAEHEWLEATTIYPNVVQRVARLVEAALDKSSFAHFVEEQEGNGPDAPSVGGKEGDAKDAARYRWLRAQCEARGGLTIAKSDGYELQAWSGDDPDRAIDAAISASQEGAEG